MALGEFVKARQTKYGAYLAVYIIVILAVLGTGLAVGLEGFVLGNPALGSRHINGVFHIGDEAAFLSAMQQGLHLKATKSQTQTVLEAEAGYEP